MDVYDFRTLLCFFLPPTEPHQFSGMCNYERTPFQFLAGGGLPLQPISQLPKWCLMLCSGGTGSSGALLRSPGSPL